MQTTDLAFRQLAQGHVRPISWQLRASFDKTFDDNLDFFILDTSLLDGPDLLSPSDGNVIAQWDKFTYIDYSDRVISCEVTREEVEPYSVVQAYADITLNNYDNYFTPNSGSPIDQYILPKRPFRILMGFGNQTVPVFVGLSESMPEIDKMDHTAKFHLIDFLSYIFNKDVTESALLTDVSTGEVLDELFQMVGLLPSQYELDDTSFNRINYFYVEKGQKLGEVINKLMEAEQGRLYLDELGIIRFLNRHNYSTTSVGTFDKSNTINYNVSSEDDIINYAKITLNILEQQGEQSLWSLSAPVLVPDGESVEIWTDYSDIITSVTTPTHSPVDIEASHYITTKDIDGTINDTDISLTDIDNFTKTSKLTFTNSGPNNAYVYAIDVWGTPVKVVDTILVEDFDQDSIDDFEEKIYEFETSYIQEEQNALSKAAILVNDYKVNGSIIDLEVKGSPAYQQGDVVTLDLDGYQGDYNIAKKIDIISDSKYRQLFKVKRRTITTFFTLDVSELDGTDVLSP